MVELKDMKKDDLLRYIAQREAEHLAELTEIRVQLFNQESLQKRLIEIERRISLQDQYVRRDCVELANIPEDIPNGPELEKVVCDIFKSAGVKVSERSFHAIHWLKNNRSVIAKVVNRRDASAILQAKKLVRNLNANSKKKLGLDKDKTIYINESLCGKFRQLLGICNTLFKQKMIEKFYTVNGVVKIVKDGGTVSLSHMNDLTNLFGDKIQDLNDAHRRKLEARNDGI